MAKTAEAPVKGKHPTKKGTKTLVKRKSPKLPASNTPPRKAWTYQKSRTTPDTQAETPSTGGLARLKTSVVHKIFGKELKFSSSPSKAKAKHRGKKLPNKTNTGSTIDEVEKRESHMKTKAKMKDKSLTAVAKSPDTANKFQAYALLIKMLSRL